ncbi:MAG: nucleotidyltransferase domain-containing protein [Bacteroidota bacterium]
MVNNLGPYHPETLTISHPLQRILQPLLYFEIFSYPLKSEEIQKLCQGEPFTSNDLKKHLADAVQRGWLYTYQGYYCCQARPDWVEQRLDNNQRAERYIRHAYRMSHLIRRFPFVRGVFLSGALSKNVMPKDGDIDYFIVTKPGRLWVSRTLLVLFKKLVLLNSHKYFCVNYFVDEDHLVIEEQNQFTATEVATLTPLYSKAIYDRFLMANAWTKLYYPNFPARDTEKTIPFRQSRIQRFLEWLLRGQLGERLDTIFYQRTIKYWQQKFATFEPEKFATALKSRPYVSKHHPQDFQNRVLSELEKRIVAFEERHQVRLNRPTLNPLSAPTE